MMDHAMATPTNNGGGSKHHLSSLLDGSVYRHAYYGHNSHDPADTKDNTTPIVFVVVAGVIILLRLLCSRMRKEEEGGGGDELGQPPLPSSGPGALADREPSAVADMEVVPIRVAEPLLVCTYRKADGWGDDESCGVCLAELADGEALRVLPACMHFFHATCLNEWLRGHDTCPLCRAPLVTPSDAT